MRIGNTELTKEDFPSYQIGREYPTRRYQFFQDTINSALNKQAGVQAQSISNTQQNPQQSANTSPVSGVQ